MGSADPESPVLPNPTFPKICVGHSMTILNCWSIRLDGLATFGVRGTSFNIAKNVRLLTAAEAENGIWEGAETVE